MKAHQFLAVAGCLLLLTACAGEESTSPTEAPPTATGSPTATVAPDSSLIAFTSHRDGNAEIYVVSLEDGEADRLTNDPATDMGPSWSPDGTQIAFTSDRSGNFDIYLMNADGTNLRQLTHHEEMDIWPEWSPDGRRIVFASQRDGDLDVYLIDPDGENLRSLLNTTSSDDFPEWSPDGSQLIISRNLGNDGTYIINLDGAEERKLGDFLVLEPAWSPDGKRIAFGSDHEGFRGLYIMDADGTNLQPLSSTHAGENGPDWSPDGSRIVFTSWRDGDGEIYVMDLDGSNLQKLTDNRSEDEFPAWQPSPSSPVIKPTPTEVVDEITFILTQGGHRRDRGINLLQTKDGGYAIVGYSRSGEAIQEDVYLVRLNPNGEVLWSSTYGGAGNDNGWDLLETDGGGFIVVGFTDSYGEGDMDIYLFQTDAKGELLWERTLGGSKDEFGWSMAPTIDGGFVLGGQTNSFGEGEEDGYLVKVNAQGEEIWSQTYGGPREDRLFSVDQAPDGGFVLTGTTRGFDAGERDLYLVKTNSLGELDWMQVLGEDRDDVGHAVRQTDDGGYIVTGYTRSFGAANYDTWLLKMDEAGDVEWETFFGDTGDDRAIYGEQTADGGYILTGYTLSFGARNWDVFLVRVDDDGSVLWHQTLGGVSEDTGYTVRGTSDGGFILTGETYSFGEGGGDMYIVKVNQDGEVTD